MKKLIRLLFLVAFTSLMFSCQKTDQFSDEMAGIDLKSAAKGAVITVLPNGVDDTENLKQAFADAAASGPGTTIQLVEGEYFCNYIEVYEFQGSLSGAGSDKTKINLYGLIDIETQEAANKGTTWWRMIGGDIVISNMTFFVRDGIVTVGDDPWYGSDLGAIFMFNNYNDEYQNQENAQSVVVKNVVFSGGRDNGEGTWGTSDNVVLEVWIGSDCVWPNSSLEYPLTKGNYLIENCKFIKALNALEGFGLGEYAKMQVKSSYFDEFYASMYFTSNYNSDIYVNNNTFINTSAYCDLLIEDIDWGFQNSSFIDPSIRCRYTIENNKFIHTFPVTAIITNDHWIYMNPEERPPMLISVKNNEFNLIEGSNGLSLNNAQDALVNNNRFKGVCQSGIAVDGFSLSDPENVPFAKNVLMQGNNFSRLNSTVANVYLGEHSMNCTVVGSKTDGKVIDEGVNNKITGMQKGKPGLKIGPSIADNHRLMRPGK